MLFSLGGFELLLSAALAVPVGLLCAFRHRYHRVGVPLIACTALAAVTTPADLASTVLLSVAFIGVFVFGSRYHLGSPVTPT
jgi:Sec-independent protein secretion pathway component TatC